MLTDYSPSQIEAFWTGVGAVAAVVTGIVAIWTLIALRHDSADRTRPMISAEMRPVLLVESPPRRALVLRNGGATPARNAKVTFDPPLPDLDFEPGGKGQWTYFLRRRYSALIATWPPGMELSNLYFLGTTGPDGKNWVNEEPLPTEFTVVVAYEDARGRSYSDRYVLDDEVWSDESTSRPSGGTADELRKREIRAVETIARGVGR